ncbi:MAG: 50S ribosomal protein L9 [Bacteroidia bacterium]
MKVILKDYVKGLGEKNDIVMVKNGYGRNFLIPKGLATIATDSAVKMAEENIRQAAHKQEKIKSEASAMAEKINGLKLSISTKAGSNGKIFGSVTTIQIAQALAERGFEVDRRKINTSSDIKMLGEYKATLDLHKEVSAEIEIEVVQE